MSLPTWITWQHASPDVTKLPEEDRAKIPGQVALYHKYHALIRSGDYYRIASYSQNDSFDCYEVVAKDQSEALITFVQVLGRPNVHSRRIRIPGLDEKKKYRVETTGEVYPPACGTECSGDVGRFPVGTDTLIRGA